MVSKYLLGTNQNLHVILSFPDVFAEFFIFRQKQQKGYLKCRNLKSASGRGYPFNEIIFIESLNGFHYFFMLLLISNTSPSS